MQPGLTHTRQSDLLAAAEGLERDAYYVAWVLRESRLELWHETEAYDEIVDDGYAEEVVYGRLTVRRDDGSYEIVVDDGGLTLLALRSQIPYLRDFELVEAGVDELPAQDASSSVPRRQWMGLWFRSQSEVRIAEALDRANALFAPNPSIRLGVTPDHRENPEPDFLVIANGKVGVLEVDGAPYHRPERADEHHERDRRFREHGVKVVERFSATDCYGMPDDVVASFLRLLDLNG